MTWVVLGEKSKMFAFVFDTRGSAAAAQPQPTAQIYGSVSELDPTAELNIQFSCVCFFFGNTLKKRQTFHLSTILTGVLYLCVGFFRVFAGDNEPQ